MLYVVLGVVAAVLVVAVLVKVSGPKVLPKLPKAVRRGRACVGLAPASFGGQDRQRR
jgi:hypothetical protein